MEKLPLLSALFIPVMTFRQQFIGVHGLLMCGKAPLKGTSVMLWNYNYMGLGHELSHNVTDRLGRFELQGNDSSLLPLNVRLKIRHHCEAAEPCIRKLTLPLPRKYIVRGRGVSKWFDAGRLDLATRYPGEVRSCGNSTVGI
ncbi:hypothetical protein GCK32_019284 [Trichostrongylus colubriformis]|uniref:Transthyretin-like family protein n=1 Tax=Trichostrongylus colubriformis TaxID=6319 RepID=A0AAN8EUJ7_TRICO